MGLTASSDVPRNEDWLLTRKTFYLFQIYIFLGCDHSQESERRYARKSGGTAADREVNTTRTPNFSSSSFTMKCQSFFSNITDKQTSCCSYFHTSHRKT